MSVAYVLEQNASINREGERLIIKKGGAVLHALHAFKLDQLILFGNVALTPQALSFLLQNKVDTVFMTLNGRYRGRLQPPLSKNIPLRCAQFQRMGEPEFCLDLARSIIAGKIANMRTVLLRLNRSREGLALDDHILSLKQLGIKLADAQDMDALRGYEGRCTALYFEGFSRGFRAEGVTFAKRVRRPPTDPVNALLSLGYALLFNTVLAAVSLVGFDPYLGALHSVEYGRPSLALDLMEEWRPLIVDALVLSIFNLRALSLNDFVSGKIDEEDLEDGRPGDVEDEAGLVQESPEEPSRGLPVKLTDSGFRKFVTQFERKMGEKVRHHLTGQQMSYRDCIREQVRGLARYVRGEETSYKPMLVK